MILDIIKGIVLVVFSFIIGILGVLAEGICTPHSRIESEPMVHDFISRLWRRSYKGYK